MANFSKETLLKLDELANEELEECGCCGEYHPKGFCGDCRDDNNRFDSVDELYNLWAGIERKTK